MTDIRKCAIIGTGFVGATTAFTLMESGLFSSLVLIDVNAEKAYGESMDLNHGIPFAQPVFLYAGNYDDLSDCGLIIIAAGANQKPGESRTELVHKNVSIFKDIISEIVKRNRNAILLIVTNPVDILTYAALKFSGFAPGRIIGSGTVLDGARLKYLIGGHLNVDNRDVDAMIIGEHGDTELAVWSLANVGGIPLQSFCGKCNECISAQEMKELFVEVRDSAYSIIEAKGATYYAVALAVRRICEAILRNENSVMTVSTLLTGQGGVDGVCLGFPCIINGSGVSSIIDMPLSEEEQALFAKSAESMREIIKTIEL